MSDHKIRQLWNGSAWIGQGSGKAASHSGPTPEEKANDAANLMSAQVEAELKAQAALRPPVYTPENIATETENEPETVAEEPAPKKSKKKKAH